MTKTTQKIREVAEQTYRWQKKIEKQLCGRTIVSVRYMTPSEAKSSGWYYQPLLIIFDDGSAICAMSDDESNNAGSIAVFQGSCEKEPVLDTIPVMRERL
tara:strand:+ start:369 stop:668 length:300 start_codon:yes stop_codon:yes gene_type:complete